MEVNAEIKINSGAFGTWGPSLFFFFFFAVFAIALGWDGMGGLAFLLQSFLSFFLCRLLQEFSDACTVRYQEY